MGKRVRRPVRRIAGTIGVVALIATGCSSGASIGSPTTTAANSATSAAAQSTNPATADTLAPPTVVKAKTTTIEAIDNDFTPKHLQISAGTKVTFVNTGHNDHDVVSDDPKAADFGVTQDAFEPGDKTTFTFTKPGTYPYYCSLHATATAGSMRGYITVTP